MCGISGIRQFGAAINEQELARFTAALSHRGPDGLGTHIDRDVGLGHTRLAILDLSESGKCPMRYRAPNQVEYWITFNGEIFNFLELREELESFGHRFSSSTDTEVIAAAYAEWGEECLFRFNGMWSFAIFNATTRSLFLARDRFGVKPLYYHLSNRFTFASELKAFLVLDGFSSGLNEKIVPLLLEHQRYDGRTDETLLLGVRSLLGGCCLTLESNGEARLRRWWDTQQHLPVIPKSYPEQVEQFRDLFLDAVRLRLRSDVPVGTCLSGGLDSSSVASTMAHLQRSGSYRLDRCASDWRQTFVASFPGTAIDETKYATTVADAIGAHPHFWRFSDEEAIASLIDSVWSADEPSSGFHVPVWCLYRELRRKRVVVSLDGHGGDELLGGYNWYLDWLERDFNQNLNRDFHSTLLPTILRIYDRCSAAHGIEVRMPIMDYRVVTYAFALPPDAKVGGGFTKRILRDAMRGIVPESIRTRRQKIGFNVPITDWFNGGLAPLIEKIVSHRVWRENRFFDSKKLGDQLLALSRGKQWRLSDWGTAYQISTYLNLAMWQILFIERSPGDLQ